MDKQTTENQTVNQLSEATIEKQRALAITHALEVEQAFKMYAYRIINHEQFTARIEELAEIFMLEFNRA